MSSKTNNNAAESTAPAVDLSQLAVKRSAPAAGQLKTRRSWFTRYIIPGGILLGFTGLFGWAAKDSFLPAHAVTVTPVIVAKAEIQQEGTPLFQAAGWIEPSPTPVFVTALASGVVESISVVEGQAVARHEPIAKLNDLDAKLSLQQAQANLRLCDADVQNAEATLVAARTVLENPNELEAALADAQSMLAATNLTLGNLPFLIEAAKNRRQLAAENLDRKERAGDGIAGRVLREAKSELAAAESALAELESREPTLQLQATALGDKVVALTNQLELLSEPKRAVAAAGAAVAAATARRDQAQLSVDAARLNLERMTIRAPIDGRVLTLDARPGTRLAGMDPNSQQSSSVVISMYDPKHLQIRVDVRLEDVPQVKIGQPVAIETAALPSPLTGEVSWITTRADIQKNTLQVKVAIHDPSEVITPEMLGQVTFLAPPQPKSAAAADREPLRMLVPRELVVSGEGGSSLWIIDAKQSVARQQAVEVGRAGTEQLVEITKGIDPTAKLIVRGRESLTDGDRVRVMGEDQSPGLSGASSAASSPTSKVAQVPAAETN
jgi:RND family efflux transporter MFP subunit